MDGIWILLLQGLTWPVNSKPSLHGMTDTVYRPPRPETILRTPVTRWVATKREDTRR